MVLKHYMADLVSSKNFNREITYCKFTLTEFAPVVP